LLPSKTLVVLAIALTANSTVMPALSAPGGRQSSGRSINELGALRSSTPQPQNLAESSDNVWRFVDETAIVSTGERVIIPDVFRTARLDPAALTQLLSKAPLEFTQEATSNAVVLSLPLPDGSFSMFRIESSPIMEAPLAAQYPEIKTYRGQGIDDPAATTRIDITPAGFHAMVLSERGTIFIDPYAKGDTTNYISYFKNDYRNDSKTFSCLFSEENVTPQTANQEEAPNLANGAVLRTYRLALAATGEYTAFTGGTVATALAAIVITMNRVVGVYERDLAVRMVLVANNNLIIYTDPSTDPYTNNSGSTMLGQNQSNLNSVIGSANYDIGHVFSTGGGGVASLGVVCGGSKARGVTGSSSPVGDGFDVDYVAHEMGHQFGALHTFNGTASSCGGGNRSSSAAYEPGSGSTIMAYAGICGSQNLQPNSDDYFHVKSLEQIAVFIGGNSCDVETNNGNTVPIVTAGSSVTIPKNTPFTLTASGSDANGDALTYCWEEYDLGPGSPPDTDADGSARPIFRSFNPTSNPSRTFPKLSDLLNNTITLGEALPAINRTMNFQVTVRDNRIGGGGINTATTQITVNASSGPFLLTQPNTAVTWTGGTQQTITWDVANTSGAPVNAAEVKLSLSTDGGNTFPIVIAASTPNDGSEVINVPNDPTLTARIKVEAVGNVFFDVSNANFTILQGSGVGADTIGVYLPSNQTFYLRNSNTPGFADTTVQYGPPGAMPLIGDWGGTGTDTLSVYDPSTQTFYLRKSNTEGLADLTFRYGPADAVPLAGDWNGDGTTTIGVYDPSSRTFYLRDSNSAGFADLTIQYGPSGGVPLVGDWDGNGTDTIGVYDPASQTFYLRNTNTEGFADITVAYGPAGGTPVVGDWNGDGTVTIGICDTTNETFYLRNANSIGFADLTIRYGPSGALPLGGDWDGL
jgi:hypothetical protein